LTFSALSQQTFKTNEERLKYANELFAQDEFLEAERYFLECLSLDQTNPDLNYKYGTCLIFASEKKDESLRFLRYAVSKK
jgi:thioredoxin-like negative regulator of GroEL